MLKLILFSIVVLSLSVSIFGQVKTDFSGVWAFDKIISHPDEKTRVASFEWHIVQTQNEIKLQTKINGGARSSISPEREGVVSYPLGRVADGEGLRGGTPVKVKAELTDKGRLILESQHAVRANSGEVAVKIREELELSADGTALMVKREIQIPGGLPITERFIARKQSGENLSNPGDKTVFDVLDLKKQFSEGVLNGKAKHLEKPDYPAAAGRATGVVPVRVIFDEQGEVVFAQAIFGHPQLKNVAVEAALKSRFEPVSVNGKVIKVSGTILYSFSR